MSKGITYEEYQQKAAEIDQRVMEESVQAAGDLQKVSNIKAQADLEKQKLSRDVEAPQPSWTRDAEIASAETPEQLQELMNTRGLSMDSESLPVTDREARADQERAWLGWETGRLDVDEGGNPRSQEAIAADVNAGLEAAGSEEERLDVLRRAGLTGSAY